MSAFMGQNLNRKHPRYGIGELGRNDMGIIKHFRRWNKWRKHSLNGRMYKLSVLLGIRRSLTMNLVLLPEEEEAFEKAIKGE
jgi:hypothetical protein